MVYKIYNFKRILVNFVKSSRETNNKWTSKTIILEISNKFSGNIISESKMLYFSDKLKWFIRVVL